MYVKDSAVVETVAATKKQHEASELIERNIVIYIWPLIARSVLSVMATIAIFGITVWTLIYSLRRKNGQKYENNDIIDGN